MRTSPSAEAHLLAGQPEQALAMVIGSATEAASIKAAALLPSAYRVQAAALFAKGDVAQSSDGSGRGLAAELLTRRRARAGLPACSGCPDRTPGP